MKPIKVKLNNLIVIKLSSRSIFNTNNVTILSTLIKQTMAYQEDENNRETPLFAYFVSCVHILQRRVSKKCAMTSTPQSQKVLFKLTV